MENNLDNPNTFSLPLTLDKESLTYLEETRRWANFLAVMGFIGLGLLVLIGLFMGTFMGAMMSQAGSPVPMQFFSIWFFAIALIYFFPILYLYRFARNLKIAIHEMNQEKLNSSLSNLKSLFKFMGIVTIIVLSIYVIILLTAGLTGLFRNM